MLQFILILLLAQEITANYGYRNYYKPHPGYYGRQKGYGYKKPFDGYKKVVNTYKKPVTAVTPYCRCIKETTMLNLVVLDQNGTPMNNAAVSVGFQGKTKEAKTDRKGFLKVEVRGCEIGIIVWHDGKQAESRIVNLEKTKTSNKNVVMQIGKACNFLIYFYSSRLRFAPSVENQNKAATLINYLADINGGEQSTSGTAVVGEENSSPLCINVQDEGSLKMVVTSQSADYFSVLCLDEVKEGGQFSMGLPFPVTWILPKLPEVPGQNTLHFVGGVNLNRVEERCREEYEMKCTRVYDVKNQGPVCDKTPVQTCEEEIIPGLIRLGGVEFQFFEGGVSDFLPIGGTDYNFVALGPDVLKKTNYLVTVGLGVMPGSHLDGNVYMIDGRGVTQIIKFPAEPFPGTGWVLGCIIDGDLKNWREINKFGPRRPRNADEFEKVCEEGILPIPV